ncbi:protein FAM234B [Poecilia reticulata]|uniref:Family with sequence similarity 234 member B n=1 Tax=Poecilia reticulata TaxID=8081 RepID=A0A3P9PRX3_POERE|nr:PREDICTED: protein FAM234B [Poecilia reticulata]
MAAALSRALKLPGKKGSELGEYDPLTQADSDDESEEDDLVLNYPRNGLGRDGCLAPGSSKTRNGRSGRLIGATDRARDDDEEEEEEDDDDQWTAQVSGKPRRTRGDRKGGQYWSRGELGNGEDRGGGGGAGPSGAAGLGSHISEAEEKRRRAKNVIRSAFFLVPLVCVMLIVLLCAFLVPCQKAELEKKLQWERALGDAGGVTPPALALWDVDGDSVEDVLLGVTEWTNGTHATQRSKVYSAVAVCAVSGRVLWREVLNEPVMYLQCGLQLSTQPSPVCLIIGKSNLMAVNGATGRKLWSVALRNIESQAVVLPDLQGDSVPDLLLATLPADENLDLSLTLISGQTGKKIGDPVPFNLRGQGKLIGPLLHETQHGAYYILFGLGNVQAISLQDIYVGALPETRFVLKKDLRWENMKNASSSSFISIYSGSERVEFLLPLVAGFGNNRNSLDSVSSLNSTRSDWVLFYGASTLSVLRQRDLHKQWTFSNASIHSEPALGHFDSDGVLDLFVQHSANGIMTALIISGASGTPLWKAEFVCPRLVLEASAISTSTGQSAFLFWASEPIRAQRNVPRTTMAPGVAAAEPLIRKLFLLHPAHPAALLQLSSTTDTAVTSAVSYLEYLKDATYITVSSRPTTGSGTSAQIVESTSLKAAIKTGQIVQLGENQETEAAGKVTVHEVNAFFRRLSFKPQ